MRKTSFLSLTPIFLGIAAALGVVGVSIFEMTTDDRGPNGEVPRRYSEAPLVGEGGNATSLSALKGSWSVVLFGYMTCPDVCPTALAYLAKEMKELAVLAGTTAPAPVRAVFISVDPERDQPPALTSYVHHFDPNFIGLTGSDASLKTITKALGAYYGRDPAPDSAAGYLVTHASSFFILDPMGRFVKTLPAPHERGAVAREMRRLMGAGAH